MKRVKYILQMVAVCSVALGLKYGALKIYYSYYPTQTVEGK